MPPRPRSTTSAAPRSPTATRTNHKRFALATTPDEALGMGLLPQAPVALERSSSDAWGVPAAAASSTAEAPVDDWFAGLHDLNETMAAMAADDGPADVVDLAEPASVVSVAADAHVPSSPSDDGVSDDPLDADDDLETELALALGGTDSSTSSGSSSSSASDASSAASCSGDDSDYLPEDASQTGSGGAAPKKRARRARDASVALMTPSAKKERRKARNRELAALSRERHRVEFEQLKEENARLKAVVARLELEKARAWGVAQTAPQPRAAKSLAAAGTLLALVCVAASDAGGAGGGSPSGSLTASVLLAAMDAVERLNPRAILGDALKTGTVLVGLLVWVGAVLLATRASGSAPAKRVLERVR